MAIRATPGHDRRGRHARSLTPALSRLRARGAFVSLRDVHVIGMYMAKLLDEIHPGEILLEDFMKPMGISARQLASDIDVSPSRISELIHGQRPITADTALRLGIYFGMEPRFWLNLQAEYDTRIVTRELKDKIAPRIRVFHPASA